MQQKIIKEILRRVVFLEWIIFFSDKVEFIISDIQSYLPAMNYMMMAFNNKEDIILYWDEPTITLDYKSIS